MLVLVTGRSGAGKSRLSKELARRLGYEYVNVDEVAHSIYEIDGVVETVEKIFGEHFRREDGSFDRKLLGRCLFNEKNPLKVKNFNTYTQRLIEGRLDNLLRGDVVADWILLPETKYWGSASVRILVEADDDLRLKKLAERDGLPLEYLEARDRASIAYNTDFDFVIKNNYQGVIEESADTICRYITERSRRGATQDEYIK